MTRRTLLALLLFLIGVAGHAQRIKTTLNDSWRFKKEEVKNGQDPAAPDQDWDLVNLPHSYNTQDAFDAKRGYYEGPTWYRKSIRLSPLKDTRYYIQFEGANKQAEVWLNGIYLGKHQGGYTAFAFDITTALKDGPNLLAVRVDNSGSLDIAPISADFTFYGGITRDVWLISTPATHLGVLEPYQNSLWYRNFQVSNELGQVTVELPVQNELDKSRTVEVAVNLLDPNLKSEIATLKKLSLKKGELKTITSTFQLKNPKLWSPANPNLYTVEAVLTDVATKQILDRVRQPLGWRWYKFDSDSGFTLNGKRLKLVGVNRHQDRAGIGPELTDVMHRQDVQAVKEMGGNFIRIAHYPQDPSLLEECDRLGIIAWEEIPIVNEIRTTEAFTNSCLAQLRDMVNQHRNHPAIVIWGYMNEVLIRVPKDEAPYFQKVVRLAKQLDSLAKALDPERYTAMALHYSDRYNKSGLADVPQVVGWNLYHGWYHDKFEDFGKYMDAEHQKYPKRPYIISEYGAGMDVRCHSKTPKVYDFTSEWGQAYHESYWKQITDRKWIAGGALWNLVDFGSEGRKETMPRINNKGLMTMERRKKDIYYYYKAATAIKPFIYVAERDQPIRKLTLPTGYKHTKGSIKLYSNATRAEVFANDKSQGLVTFNNYVGTKDVVLGPGENRIVAWVIDEVGNQTIQDVATIQVEFAPQDFSNQVTPFKEVALNVGSHVDYTDLQTGQIWEADRQYIKGNGGYLDGTVFMNNKRVGSQDEITGTEHQPLFQTRRDSVNFYQFDVPQGTYEVELLFAETDPKAKSVIYDLGGTPTNLDEKKTEREFSVWVNEVGLVQDMNLVRDYGFNRGVTKRMITYVTDNKGISIRFKASKGATTCSGIRIRKL